MNTMLSADEPSDIRDHDGLGGLAVHGSSGVTNHTCVKMVQETLPSPLLKPRSPSSIVDEFPSKGSLASMEAAWNCIDERVPAPV
jgi:hypothetical protein